MSELEASGILLGEPSWTVVAKKMAQLGHIYIALDILKKWAPIESANDAAAKAEQEGVVKLPKAENTRMFLSVAAILFRQNKRARGNEVLNLMHGRVQHISGLKTKFYKQRQAKRISKRAVKS